MSSIPSWLKKDFRHTFFDSETLQYEHIQSVFGYNWLLDCIINFYFLYLEKEKFRGKDMLFVCPNILMIMEFMDEESIKENLEPLGISKKSVIFIPINDNRNISGSSGGSHWSLLVYIRKINEYYYFDSMNNLNLDVGKNYMRKFHPYILPESKSDPKKEFCTLKVISGLQQQKNTSDCGVFTVAFAEEFAKNLDIKKIEEIDPRKFRDHILSLLKYYSKK